MSDTTLCNYSKDNLNEPKIYKNGWSAIAMSLADDRLHSGDDLSFPIKVTQVTEPSGRDGEARLYLSNKNWSAILWVLTPNNENCRKEQNSKENFPHKTN